MESGAEIRAPRHCDFRQCNGRISVRSEFIPIYELSSTNHESLEFSSKTYVFVFLISWPSSFCEQSRAVALVQSESLKLFETHETTGAPERGAFLWKERQTVHYIPPIHANQVMTSDQSGNDSTFTATCVLTAPADMKRALSILNLSKSETRRVYLC